MPLVTKARKIDPVLRGVASKFTKYEQQIYDIYIKALSQMPRDMDNDLVRRAIREAIEAGNPMDGAFGFQWNNFVGSLDKSIPTLASQLAASANISAQALPKAIQISTSFTATDPRAIAWAQQRAGARILGITKESQKAVAETIARGLKGQLNREEVIDGVTRVVGLDSRQARALGTFYEKNLNALLEEGLTYENAARAAKKLGEKYRDRLIRQRATRIARTETNAAANAGRMLSWAEADLQGFLPVGSEKRWKTSQDERNCPTCRPMHNETVPWEGAFSTGDIMPPVHVNCLCTAVIVPAEAVYEKSLYTKIRKTRKTAWLFAKHGSHNQKTHGGKGGAGDSTRELLVTQASQYETFEEFSNAISLQGLRPKVWHIADEGFELDPNYKPTNRLGGTSSDSGLFVGDPETWQDYAVGRSTVIEYDVTDLSLTTKPLADTSADFFPDQSGNQGFFIRPSAFSRLKEVKRMPLSEALSRAKKQQDSMPKSKAEARQIWEESRSVKKHGTHDQKTHAGRSGGGGSTVGDFATPTSAGRRDYEILEAEMSEHFEQLSGQDEQNFRDAAQQWQGEEYRRVQSGLLSGNPSPESQYVIDSLDTAMMPLDNDEIGSLYRGQTEGLDNLTVGDSFVSPLFQSATTDPITAAGFSKSSGGVTGDIRQGESATILRIDAMGAKGAVIPSSSEFEVVLSRGTQFTVEDITEEVIGGVTMKIIDVYAETPDDKD